MNNYSFSVRTGLLLLLSIVTVSLFYLYYQYRDTVLLQGMVFLIVSRGIIAPNHTWWSISEKLLQDASGVQMYRRLKAKLKAKGFESGPEVLKMSILGTPVNIVFSNDYVRQILEGSPYPFGVGALKQNFFKSFMSKNLGVSEGPSWEHRRWLNEITLDTGHPVHVYGADWSCVISRVLSQELFPAVNRDQKTTIGFKTFNRAARRITGAIVFGDENPPSEVFDIFEEANSVAAVLGQVDLQATGTLAIYRRYLRDQIRNPKPNSLVLRARNALLESADTDVPVLKSVGIEEELMHQIPHWIFPTVGLINSNLPRILLLLNQSPDTWNELQRDLDDFKAEGNSCDLHSLLKIPLLRAVILETLRLNNPVVTSFRTLRSDYNFNFNSDSNSGECPFKKDPVPFKKDPVPFKKPDTESSTFKKGEQFLILNNPVLRERDYWTDPDAYKPERWMSGNLEDSYYAISFNQGPQKCPGKDMSILILSCAIKAFFDALRARDYRGSVSKPIVVSSEPPIDLESVRQMINPYSIVFTVT